VTPGEVPNSELVLADPTNYRTAQRTGYDLITIHCTDGHEKAIPVAEMWQEPNHGSSAHFVIGQDGRVLQCVRLKDVAYHAHNANTTSVGIEHCARTPGELGPKDLGLPPSKAQYAASARLVAWLCRAAGLPPDRTSVRGHAEVDTKTSHQQCPIGCGWDWTFYIGLVQLEYEKLVNPVSFPNV
jgi:N-acetyl-anhydromuramyl-L-alanine amidase AmpD